MDTLEPVTGQHVDVGGATTPRDTLQSIFLRFLRFGLHAWGGPIAQIAMIRTELVDEQRWIDSQRFNRVLAVYQVLPGPEAHELCVYFGYLRRGRLGGLVAGLGFMLPGFVVMFALSWLYLRVGIESAVAVGLFYGFAPAAAALVARAVVRIGQHVLLDRWLWAIALCCAVAQLAGMSFHVPIAAGGIAYVLADRGWRVPAGAVLVAVVAVAAWQFQPDAAALAAADDTAGGHASVLDTVVTGLRAGLLTFGGAYTAIPFVQHDAVVVGDWMTSAQFLDGLALSSVLPAPLIIFTTFVGYVGAGPWGALAITVATFAPAFAFTLVGYRYVERAVENPRLHAFLDGVTAAVVGIIAVTVVSLVRSAVVDAATAVLLVVCLVAFVRLGGRWSIPAIVLGAGVVGVLVHVLTA